MLLSIFSCACWTSACPLCRNVFQVFCSFFFNWIFCFLILSCMNCSYILDINLLSIFRTNIHKTKIIASGPITSWQIDGETMETVTDFIFWGSKITADGDCSHEIKRCLLLGRKVMANLDSILKSRDIPLPTKAHLVKAMVFPVVMCGCESWTIKKAECQRIDAFELWCLDCEEIQPVHPKGDQS